jgi:2-oxoisovalerate dehydrogenase E2 component (dihydrolipoyl transacylase)
MIKNNFQKTLKYFLFNFKKSNFKVIFSFLIKKTNLNSIVSLKKFLIKKKNFFEKQKIIEKKKFHTNLFFFKKEIEFKLTDIGEGILEAEVLQLFVKPGDKIKQFDKVCEVLTDKANVEISSRYDGVVKKVHYKIGQMAKVFFFSLH